MQIKNIQQFRTNWRDNQGYNMPNWDENFIGSIHGDNSGFYKMVNGIVHNIKADLTPKLQNAQDEQAIYEFLQNAADSQSTACAVIYDEDFFMVLNNGKPFSEKDLKALLNSFQGTKSDKTKPENCEKIGRYGIGFKLAYRLMGKSDGADELLNDLAGPLIFSWHNQQQYQDLLDYQKDKNLLANEAVDSTVAPWLLKIILACFPTFPNESVKDLNYQDQVLFQSEEVQELVSFLHKHQHLLEQFNLEQGSLFFLKFGPKKHEKLKESLLNIKSGIGYALNTLKTLEKVALQDEVIERQPAIFERYSVLPNTADFEAIDPEFPSCPIEISLGFPTSIQAMKALQKAPSLYQFFPMRNERHQMAYFIHSSSFAKITDRTRLDDQGEANIETFKYIAKTLQKNLNRYRQEDLETFVQLYQGLLLTYQSTEYDAELINQHLYFPLLEYLKNNIPTNKGNFYLKDLVIAKGTALPIEPMQLGIGKEWLYWTDTVEHKSLLKAATYDQKLGLELWGLQQLIEVANIGLLNNWITNLSPDDYTVFVAELKSVNFEAELLEKFAQIKCFKFTNQEGESLFYAIDDLQAQADIFLMSEQTLVIKEAIQGLGFSVLEFNILDYAAVLQQLKSQLDYLTNDKALFEKLVAKSANSTLAAAQKHELFDFLQTLQGISKSQLRSIALFENQQGIAAPLQGLLSSDADVPNWLADFKIKPEEDADSLTDFYIESDAPWEIYSHIIVPLWDSLTAPIAEQEEATVLEFYEQVQSYYHHKKGQTKLGDENAYVYSDVAQAFLLPSAIFHHGVLEQFEGDYQDLTTAVQKVLNLALPAQAVLPLLNKDPFRLAPTTANRNWKKILQTLLDNCAIVELSANEKKALFPLLVAILSPKDLAKVALFGNIKGERLPLSNLIAPELESPKWLADFKIAVTEYSDTLLPYLATTETIYPDIIFKEWAKVTQSTSIDKDVAGFYEGVWQYARAAKSTKSLITNAYIYINKELRFVDSSAVFYHQKMSNLADYGDDYTSLQTAIQLLTGNHAPIGSILSFLQYPIFKTRDGLLSKVYHKQPVELERAEAISLIRFFELTKEDIFTFLNITAGETSRSYLVAPKERNTLFAVQKGQQALADTIISSFGEQYQQLPTKLFFAELQNKGLLHGAALFELLSKSKDASPELLSSLIMESGNASVQEQVFSKIDKIELKEGENYDSNSFEHQALQIFRNKDADHNKIRNKIWIVTADEQTHKLTDIAFSADLTIAVERFGKFSLPLAQVLPVFAQHQTLLQTIGNQLTDYEAPTLLQKRALEGDEKELEAVFSTLKKEYKVLENAAQLAFVLLYAKLQNDSKIIKNFEVHTLAEEPISLGTFDALHLEQTDFVTPAAILDSNIYTDLAALLKMEAKSGAFTFGSQQVVLAPFLEKNTFYCTPMRATETEEEATNLQQSLLDLVYQQWQETEAAQRPQEIQLQTDENNTLAGLVVAQLVYPASMALPHEQLPTWLEDWLEGEEIECYEELLTAPVVAAPSEENNETNSESETETVETPAPAVELIPTGKLSFLKAIGVHTPSSILVTVRQYLATNEGEPISQKQLNYLTNQDQQLLAATLDWLTEKEITCSSEDERLTWLRKLYNSLPTLTANTPLPYITQVLGEADAPIFEYQVAPLTEQDYYYFDNKQQTQLFDKFGISMQQVQQQLTNDNARITNLESKQIEPKTTKIFNELDLELLQQNSQEWAAAHYLKWREQFDYNIYLYEGEMPYQVQFLDRTILHYTDGNAVLEGNIVYVNSQSNNIEEDLFAIAKYNALKETDLLVLLRYKNEGQQQPTEHQVIERVVETVVEKVLVEEQLADNEEAIENPTVDKIKSYQDTKTKGELKVAFDINELPAEVLEQLMQYAKKSKIIVEKG